LGTSNPTDTITLYNWSLEYKYVGRGIKLYNIGDEDLKWRFEHAVSSSKILRVVFI